MTDMTKQWVRKAEDDFTIVCVLRRSRKRGRYDGICFHCQQCAEKYIKARLNDGGLPVPKVHDLNYLLKQLLSLEPLWSGMAAGMKCLTDFAVTTRYPGTWADRAAANQAYTICNQLRELARQSLGLTP